ncbi:MAG: transposase [Winogradskyella sp.]
MAKFKNKYRIESNRLKGWNYANSGLYFITIVTQNRVCNLGHIENNEMIKSDFGKIVNTEWFKSFEMRDELFLHQYILMPNHIHAIVELVNNDDGGNVGNGGNVETNGRSSLPPKQPPIRQPKSISSFIAGFKSSVNSKIDDYIDVHNLNIPKYNRKNHFFQPNYHDHIIRNDKSYYNISNYIVNNPIQWTADTFNPVKTVDLTSQKDTDK